MAVVADKETLVADGVDVVTLSAVPAGADIKARGRPEVYAPEPDGTFTILSEEVGRLEVGVKLWPWQDATVYVTMVEEA
jgi:hypothetical protein